MTTYKKQLGPEDRDFLKDCVLERFLSGECYACAQALHRGLGWPLVGLMQGEVVFHALVRTPKGTYFDARGEVEEVNVAQPFGALKDFALQDITEAHLGLLKGESTYYRNTAILRARSLLEQLWPDLPWCDSEATRMALFADALEALCREHGVWIRALSPGAPPVLYVMDGDEEGYVLSPLVGTVGFMFDRTYTKEG
jgi:hypothetical protein